MKELQGLGMQHHGIHIKSVFPQFILFVTSVWTVGQNGMKDMSEMLTDLVHPSGLRIGLYQRIAGGREFA